MKTTLNILALFFVTLVLLYAPAASAESIARHDADRSLDSGNISSSEALTLAGLPDSVGSAPLGGAPTVLALPSLAGFESAGGQIALTMDNETLLNTTSEDLGSPDRPVGNFHRAPVPLHPGGPLTPAPNPLVTPEPVSMLLFGTGMAGLGIRLRHFVR
jgi:hypothetical protein